MPYKRIVEAQELILLNLNEHGPLGTGELSGYTKLDDETVLVNCKKLIEKGLIHDKETKKKGKYRLVESAKLPAFLSYRTSNRSLKIKILNDIFSSKNNENIKLFDDFSKNVGIYISYVFLKAIRPGGPWTSKDLESTSSNDPRMQDIDLLRETWLADMIDYDSFFEQFLLLKGNTDYQELVKKFETSFSDTDIYNTIRFHEGIAEVRRSKKQNKKPLSTISNEELEDYDSEGLQKYLDKKGNKIKSAD